MRTYNKQALILVGSLILSACGADGSDPSDDAEQADTAASSVDAGAIPTQGLPSNVHMGTDGGSTSRPGAGAAATPTAGSLVGSWSGTLSGPSGQFAASYTFSSAGYLVLRGKELSPGRPPIQYVPSGGGVRTFKLVSISGGGNQVQMVIESSFEKASNGNLEQNAFEEAYRFTVTSSGLQVELAERSVSSFGDGDVSSSVSGTKTWTGLLQRQ